MLTQPNATYATAQTAFGKLLTMMDELREQCPWDKEQTFASLRSYSLEEVHELSEALLAQDWPQVAKELGDVLLHIVFYARLGQEQGYFTITRIMEELMEKLIRRHPHIYGNVVVQDAAQVANNWEEIKLAEGNKSALGGVPKVLPALLKAYRMQEKASNVGFDWQHNQQVLAKVNEEVRELEQAYQQGKAEQVVEEFGDLLFTLVNYARFIHINPEDALEKANQKFKSRFEYVEQCAAAAGNTVRQTPPEQLELWWNAAKQSQLS